MIVLFGATGYTGRLTAAAMVERGLRPVLAGRDPERLAVLASRLGGLVTAQAQVADRTSVYELVSRGDVLVSTVGPFRRRGWVAARVAVDAGAVYLDSTGEPPFIRSVHRWWGPQAVESGASLLTAFGHDYVPGVLAGALALREAGADARRVDVGYFPEGGRGRRFSRGTARSVLGTALESSFTWRDGRLRGEPAASRMRTFDVGGRPRPAVTTGASEHFALPRLSPGLAAVDVYVGWFGAASGAVHAASRTAVRLGQVRGVRRSVRELGELAVKRLPEGPSESGRAAVRTHVVAEVFAEDGTLLARTRLEAPEPYALTAALLAWGAGRAAERGVCGTGALDAVSAFGLDAVVAGAAEVGITRTE